MNIGGPSLVNPTQKPDDAGLILRLNQRFAAEVLQVAGDQITLSVQGVRVVAKMASMDQAASLVEQRVAQFIVKDLRGPVISLQLLKPGSPEAGGVQPGTTVASELIRRLIQNASLPLDEANINVAQALLQNGLAVTPDLVEELKTFLQGIGAWTADDLQNAAMLKAAGLPLTPGSLALARSSQLDLMQTLSDLKDQLQFFVRNSSDQGLQQLGKNAISILNDIVLVWKSSSPEMAEGLKRIIGLLGSSFEHEIAKEIQTGEKSASEGFLALARLRQELVQAGNHRLVDTIDRFLEATRWLQLTNTDPETAPGRGQWLKMDLPLQLPTLEQKPFGETYREAGLRIAYKTEGEKSNIDAGYTRLVIQIEINPGEVLNVDLSVVGKQVGAQITASSPELGVLAEEELPGFQAGLLQLGYSLKSTRCRVEKPGDQEMLGENPAHQRVNLEA